jgi:hypothetical protein
MSDESYDSIIEQNILNGYEIGYKGSRLFPTSREVLPYLTPVNQKIPIWNMVGKFMKQDLTKVSLPVILNEPLGTLQKTCEIMANIELLEKAAMFDIKDSLKRLVYATIFCIVQYNLYKDRTRKPFNPLMGETYELVQENYRFISEQVSHHPPISAFHFAGLGFEGYGHTDSKQSFKFGTGTGSLSLK